ncbi:hypothetical protein FB451DRAFT_1262237 [Mycena latifolia]|nr:hypothetical protein FB451DRAFT_1262237 [Mycena latifolia]
MCDGLVLIPMLLTALVEGALLVDWRGQRCMLLETGLVPEAPAVSLIPGHIIMATTAREKPAINIYALEALEPLWQPVDNLNFRAPTKITADPLYVLPLPMKSQPTRVLGLFVHASPLRWDTFEVTAHIEYSPSWSMADCAARRGVARLSYNVALDSDLRRGRLEWAAYVSSGRMPDDVQEMRQLSYAGYAMDGRTHRLSRSAQPPRVLEGAEQCKWTHLSAYSGVVTRVMPSAVVVSYHR